MRLASVRSLKDELKEVIQTSAYADGLALGRKQAASANSALAFGVVPGKAVDDYKLAVRARVNEASLPPELRERIARLNPREVDLVTGLRYTAEVQPGTSVAHYRCTAGTLGAYVKSGARLLALSNKHVFAPELIAKPGDELWHPSPYDLNGKPHKVFGWLHRSIPLSHRGDNRVDAALAALSEEVVDSLPQNIYKGIGRLNPRPHTNRYAVTDVVKYGRTTKFSRGKVRAVELDGVSVSYGTPNRALRFTFVNQVEFVGASKAKPFSDGGDSGSLIIDAETRQPFALLFAGGTGADGVKYTLGNFIQEVLDALKVKFV